MNSIIDKPGDESRGKLSVERRARIAELVAQHGAVYVNELSRMFGVSEVTIRSDLDVMAKQGLVVRDRGGAIANTKTNLATVFEQRATLNLEEKQRIGRAAAGLVTPGETIIMDAGTTLMEMAKSIENVAPLTVVTNAVNVATQVGIVPGVNVVLVGGSLSRETISTVGTIAERDLSDLLAQKVFLGTHAIDPEEGAVDVAIELAGVKRAMIRAARQVILLADSSKWGRGDNGAFAKVVPLAGIDIFVSDVKLSPAARAILERHGVEVILV
jgi:DeoR family transcriptional regulator of aga operon